MGRDAAQRETDLFMTAWFVSRAAEARIPAF